MVTRLMQQTYGAVIPPLVTAMVYLCATNAELHPLPASASKKSRKARSQPVQTIQVGYRIGAKLRAYAASQGRGSGTGASVAPHVRRAHFHTYRIGPGRVDKKARVAAANPGQHARWRGPAGDGGAGMTTFRILQEWEHEYLGECGICQCVVVNVRSHVQHQHPDRFAEFFGDDDDLADD